MEQKDLRTIEKELKELKTYIMIQTQLQKEILLELKEIVRKLWQV